jgi:hypothetical protein
MPAKKAAKKAAKEAAEKPPAKKSAKKAAKKAASPKASKSSAAGAGHSVEVAAYLNYRSRVERGLPGDHIGDWLAAEKTPDV